MSLWKIQTTASIENLVLSSLFVWYVNIENQTWIKMLFFSSFFHFSLSLKTQSEFLFKTSPYTHIKSDRIIYTRLSIHTTHTSNISSFFFCFNTNYTKNQVPTSNINIIYSMLKYIVSIRNSKGTRLQCVLLLLFFFSSSFCCYWQEKYGLNNAIEMIYHLFSLFCLDSLLFVFRFFLI